MSSDRREQMLREMREALERLRQECKEVDEADAALTQLEEQHVGDPLASTLRVLTQMDQKLERRIIQLEEAIIHEIADLVELHSIDQESGSKESPDGGHCIKP